MIFAACILLLAPASRFDIVFSAERFGEHLEKIYPLGPMHLYRCHSDGSGLEQLTDGDSNDTDPSVSKNGRSVLFWRSPRRVGYPWTHPPYRLFSIDTTTKAEKYLKVKWSSHPPEGAARIIERNGSMVFRGVRSSSERDYLLKTKKGRLIRQADHALASADARYVIATSLGEGQTLVDLRSGKSQRLGGVCADWIGDHTIAALKPNSVSKDGDFSPEGKIVLMNLQGRVTDSIDYVDSSENEGWDGLLTDVLVYSSHPVPLKDRRFLWTAHHQMSDGGYDYLKLVDFNKGSVEPLCEHTLDAVAPDGNSFLTSHYKWVGGYKGVGTAKLGTMYVWDANTLAHRFIGFRRMICWGACFIRVAQPR